jgi:hypothetical protein
MQGDTGIKTRGRSTELWAAGSEGAKCGSTNQRELNRSLPMSNHSRKAEKNVSLLLAHTEGNRWCDTA